MTSQESIYKFEQDVTVAFRSILQLSSNYRILQEKYDSQEEIIRELKEEIEILKNPNLSKEKISVNKIDISNNLLSEKKVVDSWRDNYVESKSSCEKNVNERSIEISQQSTKNDYQKKSDIFLQDISNCQINKSTLSLDNNSCILSTLKRSSGHSIYGFINHEKSSDFIGMTPQDGVVPTKELSTKYKTITVEDSKIKYDFMTK